MNPSVRYGNPLTALECQILQLRANGLQRRALAEAMGRSYWTIHAHLAQIRTKLGVGTTLEAVAEAWRRRLIY